MKKVLIIVAGLFGAALFATSCVETTESESVTALREAKVAQMQALADQERYQAQLDSIEAAIKNATSAAELEKLLAKYQYQLLNWQKQMQDKEQEMLEGANQHIAELYTDYKTALGDLNEMRLYLVTKTTEKAQLESDIISLDAYIAKETHRLEREIAQHQAEIEMWNQYDGVDKKELESEKKVLEVETKTLSSDLMYTYEKISNLLLGDVNDVLSPFGASIYNYPAEPSTIAAINAVDTLAVRFGVYPQKHSGYYGKKEVVTADDVTSIRTTNATTYLAERYIMVYDYNQADTLNKRIGLENAVTSAETYLGAPSTTGTNAEPASGLYVDLEDYQTQLKAAQKADPKDEQLIKSLEDQIKLQEALIEDAKKALADAEAELAMFDRNVKCFQGDALKAYQDAIEALKTNETIEAFNEAVRENNDVHALYSEASTRYNVINDLLTEYAPVDVDQKILDLQSSIAEAQKDIAELTNIAQTAEGYDDPRAAMELLLANIDAEIALINEQIALLEQIVASAKAALEEALAGESTPAE